MFDIIAKVTQLLSTSSAPVLQQQVQATVALLDGGASVPFIARYRKEITGGLDDAQLRDLEVHLRYWRELEQRRQTIVESITSQQKMTDLLQHSIDNVTNKAELEELYLPYKPKKTSKALKAIEAGLLAYAERLLTEAIAPLEAIADYNCGSHEAYASTQSQLDGIGYIIIERWAEQIALVELLKQQYSQSAQLHSSLSDPSKEQAGQKFRDYFESEEALATVSSHRLLAMLRGQQEGMLKLSVTCNDDVILSSVMDYLGVNHALPSTREQFLRHTATLLWKGKLRPQLETSLLSQKRQQAEAEAIKVFGENLRHLLLAAPAGRRTTLGVDPGIRTGVKLAVINTEGDVVAHSTIYPFAPKNDEKGALATLQQLCLSHNVELIAIGNGTASRETDALIATLLKQLAIANPTSLPSKVTVSEAGASVYSASALASKELPQLDVSIRGAVSIARRLQDPLAELVKIDPKSIGVGQYQHDVSQVGLAASLDAVVEDCVNAVGVDVNTGSEAILARVAGLNTSIAQQIVEYRRVNGAFNNRDGLKKVPRLGAKTFEQAAGFLRIHGGDNPLDASAVHPESYTLVTLIANTSQVSLTELVGKTGWVANIKVDQLVSEQYGLPTVQDVVSELQRPGRDPRPQFSYAKFSDSITQMADLKVGMQLEGVVTNVTNFGAFVDVGVHQDGLVHISMLADKFVSDPHQVVKPGQIVQVKVLEVDVARKRISLSMRLNVATPAGAATSNSTNSTNSSTVAPRSKNVPRQPAPVSAAKASQPKLGSFGDLLRQAGVGSK